MRGWAARDAGRPRARPDRDCRICTRPNIELGGEWIETRLLNSGPRTNPWYQEASARVIENGDMIVVNSDLIGPQGYSADISRSWLAGDRRARRPAPAVCCRACAGAGEYRAFPPRHDAPRDRRGGDRAARALGRAPGGLHRPWDRSVQRVSAGAASAPLRARRPRRGGAGEHGVQRGELCRRCASRRRGEAGGADPGDGHGTRAAVERAVRGRDAVRPPGAPPAHVSRSRGSPTCRRSTVRPSAGQGQALAARWLIARPRPPQSACTHRFRGAQPPRVEAEAIWIGAKMTTRGFIKRVLLRRALAASHSLRPERAGSLAAS